MGDIIDRIPERLREMLAPAYNGPASAADKDMLKTYGVFQISVCKDGALRWWGTSAFRDLNIIWPALIAAVCIFCSCYSFFSSLIPYLIAIVVIIAAAFLSPVREYVYDYLVKHYLLEDVRDYYEIKDDTLTVYHFDYPYIDDISQFFSGSFEDTDSAFWLNPDRKHYFLYSRNKQYYEQLRSSKSQYVERARRGGFPVLVFDPLPQAPLIRKFNLRTLVSAKSFSRWNIMLKFADGREIMLFTGGPSHKIASVLLEDCASRYGAAAQEEAVRLIRDAENARAGESALISSMSAGSNSSVEDAKVFSLVPEGLRHLLTPPYTGPSKAPDRLVTEIYRPGCVSIGKDGMLRWWSLRGVKVSVFAAVCVCLLLAFMIFMCIASSMGLLHGIFEIQTLKGLAKLAFGSYYTVSAVIASCLCAAGVYAYLKYYSESRSWLCDSKRSFYEIGFDILTIYNFEHPYIDDISQFFSGCYADKESVFWTNEDRKHYYLYTEGEVKKDTYLKLRARQEREERGEEQRGFYVFYALPQAPEILRFNLHNLCEVRPVLFELVLLKFADGKQITVYADGPARKVMLAVLASYLPKDRQDALLRRMACGGSSNAADNYSGIRRI